MKEIFILCNSPECLAEITSGQFPDLHTKDIFTCGNAFTFFRTSGNHLNFVTDAVDIIRQIANPEYLFKDYRNRVGIIFSAREVDKLMMQGTHIPPGAAISPVNVGASSAINALFYINAIDPSYDVIHLVGYTINEWDGMESFPSLREKKIAFDAVFENYRVTRPRPYVYKYTRK